MTKQTETDRAYFEACQQKVREAKWPLRHAEGGVRLGDPLPLGANSEQVAGTHYTDMGVQPWDVVGTWPLEQQIGYYRGGALKYVMRLGTKDEPLQEARKAGHYIEKLIEVLTKSNPQGGI